MKTITLIEVKVSESEDKAITKRTDYEVGAENEKYIALKDDNLTKLEKLSEGQTKSEYMTYLEEPKIDKSPWATGVVISGVIYTRENKEKAEAVLLDEMFKVLNSKVEYYEAQKAKLLTDIIE